MAVEAEKMERGGCCTGEWVIAEGHEKNVGEEGWKGADVCGSDEWLPIRCQVKVHGSLSALR